MDNFLLDNGQNGFGMLPMSKQEHVIPAPASRLLGFAEYQPNLICYGVSGLKPGSVRLLVPSLKAGVIRSAGDRRVNPSLKAGVILRSSA